MSDNKLVSRLPDIADKLPDRGEHITFALAEFIADTAKIRAPVGSSREHEGELPHLRDSIEARHFTFGAGRGITKGAAVVAVFYWFFVEFGTKNQAPHPFMIPAAELARAAAEELSAQYLDGL